MNLYTHAVHDVICDFGFRVLFYARLPEVLTGSSVTRLPVHSTS